jgi:hypothetical protein
MKTAAATSCSSKRMPARNAKGWRTRNVDNSGQETHPARRRGLLRKLTATAPRQRNRNLGNGSDSIRCLLKASSRRVDAYGFNSLRRSAVSRLRIKPGEFPPIGPFDALAKLAKAAVDVFPGPF